MVNQPLPSISAVELRDVTVHYGDRLALDHVSFSVRRNSIFAIFGPANSGKSTVLRCINRTLELHDDTRWEGSVRLNGVDVATMRDVHALRRRVGMVFPLPVGLPLSVFDNVAYAPRQAGLRQRAELEARVERCLRQAMLWDEVKDRLHALGTNLSGGQQQRLTLARALSHEPEVLCLDEFSIAIDPITTGRIEETLRELRRSMTIVVVTNLVQQAHRLADDVMFLNAGQVVETGSTDHIFHAPQQALTHAYLTGAFG